MMPTERAFSDKTQGVAQNQLQCLLESGGLGSGGGDPESLGVKMVLVFREDLLLCTPQPGQVFVNQHVWRVLKRKVRNSTAAQTAEGKLPRGLGMSQNSRVKAADSHARHGLTCRMGGATGIKAAAACPSGSRVWAEVAGEHSLPTVTREIGAGLLLWLIREALPLKPGGEPRV